MNPQTQELDMSQIEFAKSLYNFVPENNKIEIELKTGDLVAIISKVDPMGNPSQWWKVRTRDGKVGYAPSNYLELIKRKQKQQSQQHQIETV